MTHPLVTTRKALLTIFKEALAPQHYDVDVFDWRPKEYAKSAVVIIGNSRAQMERDRFATPTRLPFRESWDIDVTVQTTFEDITEEEMSDYILSITDVLLTSIAVDPRLGGIDYLIRCFPSDYNINVEDGALRGVMTLSCEYRIDRRAT